MEVQEYSEKSLVVYGDTQPWKENLKEIGARFNPRLKDGPGWIIAKSREETLNDFIKQANEKLIEPLEEYVKKVVSKDFKKSMSPEEALEKIKKSKQFGKTRTVLPKTKTTLDFPNRFLGGDGLNYQVLIYTVILPNLGQKVSYNTDNYIVTNVKSNHTIYITKESQENSSLPEKVVLINGKWKLKNYNEKHVLIFH